MKLKPPIRLTPSLATMPAAMFTLFFLSACNAKEQAEVNTQGAIDQGALPAAPESDAETEPPDQTEGLSNEEVIQRALAEAMPKLVEEALSEVPAARPYVNPVTGEFDMEAARREAGDNGSLLLSIIGIEAEYGSALSRAIGSFYIRSATANL